MYIHYTKIIYVWIGSSELENRYFEFKTNETGKGRNLSMDIL